MKICYVQGSVTHYAKNQENLTLNEKRKNIPTTSDGEMAEMLELSDTDFKAAKIKMLQKATTDMLEMNEKIKSLSKEKKGVFGKGIEDEEPNGNF